MLGNAKVFGFAEGLKLKGKEFNNLVTFFYVSRSLPYARVCKLTYLSTDHLHRL